MTNYLSDLQKGGSPLALAFTALRDSRTETQGTSIQQRKLKKYKRQKSTIVFILLYSFNFLLCFL